MQPDVSRPWPEDTAHGNIIVLVLFSVPWAVFTSLFYARRHLEPIKSRGWELSLVSSLFTYLGFFLVSLSLESMFHGYEWSCHWFVWVAPLLVPLWLYPVVLRAWRLFFNYFASRYFMRHVGKLTDDNQKKVIFRRFRFTRTNRFATIVLSSFCIVALLAQAAIVLTLPDSDPGSLGLSCQEHTKLITLAEGICAAVFVSFFIHGLWGVDDVIGLKLELMLDLILMSPLFLLWAILSNIGEPAFPFTSMHVANILIAEWFVISIVLPVVWSYHKQFDAKRSSDIIHLSSPDFLEALGLKRGSASSGNPPSTATVTATTVTATGDEGDHDIKDTSKDLDVAVAAVVDVAPKNTVDQEKLFRAVLGNPIMRRGFETYAIKSWCVENLVFWLDVQSFKANVAQEDMSPADKLKQAKRIFFTYIVEGAELNVNIDQTAVSQVSIEIEKGVMDETYVVQGSLFELAERQVFQQMLTDTFLKWKATDHYETSVVKLMDHHKGTLTGADRMKKHKLVQAPGDQGNNNFFTEHIELSP